MLSCCLAVPLFVRFVASNSATRDARGGEGADWMEARRTKNECMKHAGGAPSESISHGQLPSISIKYRPFSSENIKYRHNLTWNDVTAATSSSEPRRPVSPRASQQSPLLREQDQARSSRWRFCFANTKRKKRQPSLWFRRPLSSSVGRLDVRRVAKEGGERATCA